MLKNGYVTFASFSNPAKINKEMISLWAKILQGVENSRLLLKYKGFGAPANVKRLTALFDAAGVPSSRLILEGRSPHVDLLARYNEVDIALDPFPYSGGLTTYEALWMGVPVITMPGDTFASRHSLSHLSTLGLPELVADTSQQYVELAISLAGDDERLSGLRSSLRDKMAVSPLCDGERFARNYASLLQGIWREWCSG